MGLNETRFFRGRSPKEKSKVEFNPDRASERQDLSVCLRNISKTRFFRGRSPKEKSKVEFNPDRARERRDLSRCSKNFDERMSADPF